MSASNQDRERYLGMRPGDMDGKPYARHWNPRLSPLPADVCQALSHGPVAAPLLPPLEEAAEVFERSSERLEFGYAAAKSGGLRIALCTQMPRVVPGMIDWWFGWHSDEPQRYKLWHPLAHVHAAWKSPPPSGSQGRARYVGQTSFVDEYVGSELGSYAIRFLPPAEVGLDERRLADPQQATAVCARIGFVQLPFDFGYLIHYLDRTSEGCRMRSRFWVGGEHAQARGGGPVGAAAVQVAKRLMKPSLEVGRALLVHCSQEMSHLATFLPDLHAELANGAA